MSTRMGTSPATRLTTLLATCLAGVLLLGACGTEGSSDDEPTADRTAADESSTPTSETASDPTSDPASEPTVAETTTAPAAPAGLRTRLLSARELPGVNELTRWRTTGTRAEKGAAHGACQKFSLVDIGADSSLVRSYVASSDVTALQVLGEFADPKSAWRAHQVVKSWAAECAQMLDAEVEKVSRLTPVPVTAGVAQKQLLQYGEEDAEAHTFAGVGITRRGRYLSIVQIDVVGQDYNFEAGQEPAHRAAVAAADKLA